MSSGDVTITTAFDTGDEIVHKPTSQPYMVACVHGQYLHTSGNPEQRLMVSECVLKRQALERERRAHLEQMAKSTSKNHRAECARTRLAEMIADEPYMDPYYGE
jgi:hypothetical protein